MSMHSSDDDHDALGGSVANAILTDRLLLVVESKTLSHRNETCEWPKFKPTVLYSMMGFRSINKTLLECSERPNISHEDCLCLYYKTFELAEALLVFFCYFSLYY